FPEDALCYEAEDQYLFGPKLLVAPVMEPHVVTRSVYLPAGCQWKEIATGKIYDGGVLIDAKAPIDIIPVFEIVKDEMLL
ncbi:MAG TPA: glycoside hydrolase family 31 protein, partial [Lachnospiraceae bacterium]|nr:glycoside hydrolase family 31 protein [Lachnospiraceae bacterium]